MTVGELKKALSVYVDDTEVITKKTEIFGNVGYVHRVKVDAFAFFGRSIPCVLLTDDFEDDCEDSRPAWHPLREVTDSDTISRQAAYETLTEYYHHTTEIQHKALREALERVPSAQPEIIRCKECKWKQGSECVRFAEVRPFPDDYCSRAERRTDE